jgi:hypothetical protein
VLLLSYGLVEVLELAVWVEGLDHSRVGALLCNLFVDPGLLGSVPLKFGLNFGWRSQGMLRLDFNLCRRESS